MLRKIQIVRFAGGKEMNNPKLSSTVSVVKISDDVIEFFKTNTRSQVRLRTEDDTIYNIVNKLDGTRSIEELAKEYDTTLDEINGLLSFLQNKGILDTSLPHDDLFQYDEYRRVIHFIEEFATSHDDLIAMWEAIRRSKVLVIGLGAVGSWVSCNLVQSGVKELYLMDNDLVDITNLHRQFAYRYSDVGELKIDAMERRLKEYDSGVVVHKTNTVLTEGSLSIFDNENIDLIINCADKPNVDTTSLWVGEYGMKRRIPHIIGGGYNLHLSLIGQTVIPGKSACVKCFQKKLEEENTIDRDKVKKLAVKNRKVGSFGPMCSIIASMIGMEAIKILSRKIQPSNVNRRGEFDVYSMNIQYKEYERRCDCEWCGEKGKYIGL